MYAIVRAKFMDDSSSCYVMQARRITIWEIGNKEVQIGTKFNCSINKQLADCEVIHLFEDEPLPELFPSGYFGQDKLIHNYHPA